MKTFELTQDRLHPIPGHMADASIDGVEHGTITRVEFVYDAHESGPATLKITALAFDGTDPVEDTLVFDIGKAKVVMEVEER